MLSFQIKEFKHKNIKISMIKGLPKCVYMLLQYVYKMSVYIISFIMDVKCEIKVIKDLGSRFLHNSFTELGSHVLTHHNP